LGTILLPTSSFTNLGSRGLPLTVLTAYLSWLSWESTNSSWSVAQILSLQKKTFPRR